MMQPTQPTPHGAPPRLVIQGGRVLNVFTGELLALDVVLEDGRISALTPPGESPEAGRVVDAAGGVLVPGYVEPHAHLGLVAGPLATLQQWAVRGTTAVVADTYPWFGLLDDGAMAGLMEDVRRLPVYVRWFLAPHARSFWPDEAERFGRQRLESFLRRDDVVAIGEITRWPMVEQGDPDLAAKIAAAHSVGKRVEGHSAGASPLRVMRLAQRGFTSCHEAINAVQVLDRLRAGLYVMLRHSSLRPDLPALLEAVRGDLIHSNRLMLTADGPMPPWVEEHGYLDHLIRLTLEAGVPPPAAYRMATLNPAMYYRIEHDVGSITPGRRGDVLVLESLDNPTPRVVVAGGVVVAENGRLAAPWPAVNWGDLKMAPLRPPDQALLESLPGPGDGGVPVLELAHTVIVRRDTSGERPLLAVLHDRDGRWMTHGWLTGFARELAGLATSYNPAHHLLLLGHSPADMALAARRVADLGGGLVLAEQGRIVWELGLERGGFFTERPWPEVVAALRRFENLLVQRGYRHGDPMYSLFFLSFDSLPDYRLTVRGLWDVKGQRPVAPPRPLG